MLTLRPYQQTGVDNIRGAYIQKFKAPLFVLPTGGGKTVVFCHIAQQSSSRGKRVLILVHRVELLRQTSAALTKSGVRHGLINPKYTPDLTAAVQVASVQTLVNRLNKYPVPDIIVIDEAHHATAGSWRKVTEYYSNALILGVTATPIRGDGKGLHSFDTLIMGPQISELIEMGYLVQPIIYAPKKRPDFSSVKITRGDYDKSEVINIMDKPTITGDAVAHYKKLCSGVPAVAFCVSIAHAEHVAESFRKAGYRAYSVDGTMDDDTRSRILNGLGNGSIEVVTSCDLISEGTDIPAIGCAILLRPTQSTGLYLQQVGRALRPSSGKTNAIILDHVGNTMVHGFPDDEREWSLSGMKKRSRKQIQEAAIAVRQCAKCYAVSKPAPVCPYCGDVKEIKSRELLQVEGELEEIKRKKVIKQQRRTEVANAETLEDLIELGESRNYKPGWARAIYKARQEKKASKTEDINSLL